jgi:hypothetical protein
LRTKPSFTLFQPLTVLNRTPIRNPFLKVFVGDLIAQVVVSLHQIIVIGHEYLRGAMHRCHPVMAGAAKRER